MSYLPLIYLGKTIKVNEDKPDEEIVLKHGALCATDPKESFSTSGLSKKDSHNFHKQNAIRIASIFLKSMEKDVPTSDLLLRRPCKLAKHSWYFGEMNRSKADNILKGSKPGTFLVRKSPDHTDFVLEISETPLGERSSFRIKKKNGLYYLSRILNFKSINHLIEFYYTDINGSLVKLIQLTDRNSYSKELFLKEFEANNWILKEKYVTIGKQFDDGEYGIVYKGTYKELPVAIKVLKNEQAYIDNFLVETAYLTFCCHKNIICLYGVMLKENKIYSVVEFCENGSLEGYLHSQGKNQLRKRDLISYAMQLSSALTFMSQLKLVHRDVAARNVLLTEDMVAKLCDFGSTTTEYSFQRPIELAIRWTAPEIYTHKIHSQYSDVWSYGVFLWELFTYGRNPYPKWKNEEIVEKLLKGNRMTVPEQCPSQISDLIIDCWNIVPNKRPTFSHIYNFLGNLDIYKTAIYEEVCIDVEDKNVYEVLD